LVALTTNWKTWGVWADNQMPMAMVIAAVSDDGARRPVIAERRVLVTT
jgi:hypothetical protein